MSKARDKGTAAETAVVRHLRNHGFTQAERAPLWGAHDRGDIYGIPGWVLQVKNQQRLDIPGWWRDTLTQAENADRAHPEVVNGYGPHHPLLIAKRKGHPNPCAWYAITDLSTFTRLLRGYEGL